MPKVTIKDPAAGPYNGEWDLDFGTFTNRELHIIKREAGVRVGELQGSITNMDNDLMVAFAFIALRRAGRNPDVDILWELPVGAILLEDDDEEAVGEVAVPPQSEPPSASEQELSGEEDSRDSETTSTPSPVSIVPSSTGDPS